MADKKEIYNDAFSGKVKFWTGDMEVEQAALEQITNISQLPILAGHMSIMADVHMGKGATVGSVIPTRNAIIPAAVGVDIGCGMCAVMTNLTASDLPESLLSLRNQIERDVPVGFNEHSKGIPSVFAWRWPMYEQKSSKEAIYFTRLGSTNFRCGMP